VFIGYILTITVRTATEKGNRNEWFSI
jgi:hypothetical protein